VVEGRAGRGLPGYSRAEAERARRERCPDAQPDRVVLAGRVRASAASAGSELAFVTGLQQAGVLTRPRYGKGGRSEVVGYSVALQPVKKDGGKPVWYGGGSLAADLTLPRLRAQWRQGTPAEALPGWAKTPTPENARGAGKQRGRRPVDWSSAAEGLTAIAEQFSVAASTAFWWPTAGRSPCRRR
jgi:hypothetical protein